MTGKGQISKTPNQRLRLMAVAHGIWLVLICVLGAWWGQLLFTQAKRIAELESHLGMSTPVTLEHWARTQRMLVWESASFFALLIAATLLLFMLYWRESRRARALQAFFASVTHELRTPLTSIRLQAEMLAEKLSQDQNTKRLVGRLLEDTSRLESQVERTLELARVEGGGLVLSQAFLVKPWLEYFLRTWSEDHGSNLSFSAAVDGECQIQADPAAVQVILRNLLDNSLRHAKTDQLLHIELASEDHGGWVVIRYFDNGGAFEGDVSKLGTLFHKGATSQGAGVGLYLISALMRRMGGRAEFSAAPGLITKLWFKQGGGSSHA